MKKTAYQNRHDTLQKYGQNSLSYLTLSDNLEIFTGDWNGYIAYKKIFKTLIVLGNPIVPLVDLKNALNDFKNKQNENKNHICFFVSNGLITDELVKNGFKGFIIGHEAIVTLSNFSIAGRKGWSIRSSVNYAIKLNLMVEEYNFKKKRVDEVEKQLHKITNEWCKIKKMPELTFAFGHVDLDTFKDARVFICRKDEMIVGFLIYFPIYGLKSYYLDLSRRGADAPRGTIDFLIVKSFEILRNEGIKKIFIGYSPGFNKTITSFNSRYGSKFFKISKPFLELIYPTKTEFVFKNKYATDWEPNYFFYYPHISIRMLFGLIHAIYVGGIAGIIFGKLKYLFKS